MLEDGDWLSQSVRPRHSRVGGNPGRRTIVRRVYSTPLSPPLLLRRIYDLGGKEKLRFEGHPQTPGSVPLHRSCGPIFVKEGPQGVRNTRAPLDARQRGEAPLHAPYSVIPAKAGIQAQGGRAVLGGPRFVVAVDVDADMTEHVPPLSFDVIGRFYALRAARTPSAGSVFRTCPDSAQPRRAMPTPKRMSVRCSVA